MKTLNRYIQTLRYLSFKQMLYRGYYVGRRRWWRLVGKQADFNGSGLRRFRPAPLLLSAALQQRAAGMAKDISKNRFCFLNQPMEFGEDIDWEVAKASQLWRYNLHYFNYVVDLIVWGSQSGTPDIAAGIFSRIACSWLNDHHEICGDAWHPYPLSLRMVNWLHGLAAWPAYFDEHPEEAERIVGGIYGQARYLAGALEKDVRGNHLLKNIKAMIWAGIACQGRAPEGWLAQSLNLLHRELDEQILPDGGHFERTPGYHLDVMADLLNLAWLLRLNHAEGAPIWLDNKLRYMSEYLAAILTPNNHLPLLKDTTYCDELEPAAALAAVEAYFKASHQNKTRPCPPQLAKKDNAKSTTATPGLEQNQQDQNYKACHFVCSGYVVLKNISEQDHLIIDVGAVCPEYLPAHAHADMLNFELTVSGCKIICDAGVYEYADGNWRSYFRSTRAHNTVEVGGANQSDVWASFRVGRRARIISSKFEDRPLYAWVEASHDGYVKHQSAIHLRRLIYIKTGIWVVIDEVNSSRKVSAINYIHLYPGLEPVMQSDGNQWQISGASLPVYITALGGCTAEIGEGWCSEAFGSKKKASVLKLRQSPSQRTRFVYVISKFAPISCEWGGEIEKTDQLMVKVNHLTYNIDLSGMRMINQ